MNLGDMHGQARWIAHLSRSLTKEKTSEMIILLVQKAVVEGIDIDVPVDFDAAFGEPRQAKENG